MGNQFVRRKWTLLKYFTQELNSKELIATILDIINVHKTLKIFDDFAVKVRWESFFTKNKVNIVVYVHHNVFLLLHLELFYWYL